MTRPESVGKRVLRSRPGRVTALAGLMALVLSFSGDRAQGAGGILGIDPLEILNLQVKPNVIIVLDSSGSMQNRLDDRVNTNAGDSGAAKLRLAKTVLREVIRDNADQASFMFGQYTQSGTNIQNTGYTNLTAAMRNPNDTGATNPVADSARFVWETTDTTMVNTYPIRAQLLTPAFPLLVDGANSNFRFNEGARTCAATVAGASYTAGATLATAIQAAMNTATCSSTQANTYRVTFDAPNWRFTVAIDTGTADFRLLASNAAGSTDLGPDIGWTGNTTSGTATKSGANLRWLLVRLNGEGYNDAPAAPFTRYYQAHSTRFFNGQVLSVLPDGTVCSVAPGVAANGLLGPPVDAGPADPYHFMLQRLSGATCAVAGPDGSPIKFVLAGANYQGNSIGCNGFAAKVELASCLVEGSTQVASIDPFLKGEVDTELGRSGSDCVDPATCPVNGYRERRSGLLVTAPAQVGIYAAGSTPIGNSLRDIRGIFGGLWNTEASPGVGNIQSHSVPRERTLVLFVTDGDDTCTSTLSAARQAQLLYDPIDGSVAADGTLVPTVAGDEDSQDRAFASSVTTYVVNFGSGASVTNSNHIAWGGSGLLNGTWASAPTDAQRANCVTCRDAFDAPDASTLAAVLNGIINQGAQAGLFTSQQSLISTVYEYVAEAPVPAGQPANDPTDPTKRFRGIVPVRYEATFTLPGFQGQVKAFTNDQSDNAVLRWSAGDKLKALVDAGMNAPNCPNATPRGPLAGYCSFNQLGGGGVIGSAAIKRHIYTTDGNGVFGSGGQGVTLTDLHNPGYLAAPADRVTLWPATLGLAASDALDVALGISAFTFTELKAKFRVCTPTPSPSLEPIGTPAEVLPAACSVAGDTQLAQALLETRQIILAYMAGAEPYLTADALPRRSSGAEILFKPRDWLLAESTLATPAVVGSIPVIQNSTTGFEAVNLPMDYVAEYNAFAAGSAGIQKGFGLGLGLAAMTVLYVPANDMLHAFRAAQCLGCADTGGEELWGFVPYDQLGVLTQRFLNKPPRRDPHDYMFSTSVRVAEVLFPGTWSFPSGCTSGDPGCERSDYGAWRRILYIGRGITGKYITALDITGPGDYATTAVDTTGPVPLWSRGNPDTLDGTPGGTASHTAAEKAAYATMGETWSVPAVGFVKSRKAQFTTSRRPAGLEFVAFVGSGYGEVAGEGQNFYALDPLTGDITQRNGVAAGLDVEPAAANAGLTRTGLSYSNALVASPAAYVKEQFELGNGPLSGEVASLYFGDLHGRLWKVLTADFATADALPGADLGADQPVAVPVALLGLPFEAPSRLPHIFATSGNDVRSQVPFKAWGFRDEGGPNTPPSVLENGVNVFPQFRGLFTRELDPPPPQPNVPPFRGTVQPATVRGDKDPDPTQRIVFGVALFAAARFNPAGSPEAPPPFPCRSSFDSIVYVLDAETGGVAFNTGQGDGTYVLQKNSRVVGIGTAAAPDPATGLTTTQIYVDEGLKKAGAPPAPPPKKGMPLQQAGAVSASVPGDRNVAIFSLGSSVCGQQQ